MYRVICADEITEAMVSELEAGVQLNNENEPTKPAKVNVLDKRQMELTIFEGKYHQVKRMLAAVGNKVIELHRLQIASIALDEDLAEGEWRYLSKQEWTSIN